MGTWSFCSVCDRWFCSPRNNAAGRGTCPVCGVHQEAFTDQPPAFRPPANSGRRQPPDVPASTDIDDESRPNQGRGVPAATAVKPDMPIQGLCPKCRGWFDCEDWFDRGLPQPCCPGCGLGPIRLQYQPAQGSTITVELTTSELWIG